MAKCLTLILILALQAFCGTIRYFHMKVQLLSQTSVPSASFPIFLSLSYKFIILPKPAPYLFYISLKSITSNQLPKPESQLHSSPNSNSLSLSSQIQSLVNLTKQVSPECIHFPGSPAQCSGHHLTAVTASEWSLCLLAYSPYNHRNFYSCLTHSLQTKIT